MLTFAAAVDFEIFRPKLIRALAYSDGAKGGRPPFDPVTMFKILVIQAANNLSDERTEFLINDRLSFMRFLGLGLADRVPDARTIWLFREKRVRWYQGYRSASWRVDETYVRVGGAWKYLFRAVDQTGRLIDFMLSDRRNTRAAHRFLGKALKTMRNWPPVSITTDKLGSYQKAIRRLQRDGHLSQDVTHRTSKYLNNIVEADHGALKQVIRPARGFQTMKTAYATINGFEIMRMIRRGHCILREPGAAGEVGFINKLFGLPA